MRVYVAGPIKGMVDGNRAMFAKAADILTERGHEPLNPWDIPPDHGPAKCCPGQPPDHGGEHNYGCYLRADIEQLMYCDAIALLPGWQDSTGASTEERVARAIGLAEVELDELS